MSFSIDRPYVFWFIIPVVLSVVYTVSRYSFLKSVLTEKNALKKKSPAYYRLKRCFWLRTIFRFISGLCIILAMAGFSWGIDVVPVQKNGRAVSFVFDISYSMLAKDAPEGKSRLEAASLYAKALLEKMGSCRVSVVLAKGDGIVALPLTDDFYAVENLIDCLSPDLMSAQGTSIGKGINAAFSSFPAQSSENRFVWVFTDCEETDSLMASALSDSMKYGIPVTVIGFGSEKESEIFTGDNKTKVKTALRSENVQKIIDTLSKNKIISSSVNFIEASETGSAIKLLRALNFKSGDAVTSYEVQVLKRYKLFILLAIVFYLLSVFLGELNLKSNKRKRASVVSCLFIMGLFSGCNGNFAEARKNFSGTMEWRKENYQKAVAEFLDSSYSSLEKQNETSYCYSIYNLSTTYLMQGESDAALQRYIEIFEYAPESVKLNILYNQGIIAHRDGDYKLAASYFKQALIIDPNFINAKINLELSLKDESIKVQESAQSLTGVSENKDETVLESSLYSLLREQETTVWKNMKSDSQGGEQDY